MVEDGVREAAQRFGELQPRTLLADEEVPEALLAERLAGGRLRLGAAVGEQEHAVTILEAHCRDFEDTVAEGGRKTHRERGLRPEALDGTIPDEHRSWVAGVQPAERAVRPVELREHTGGEGPGA